MSSTPSSHVPQKEHSGATLSPAGSRRTFFQWVTRAAAGLIGISLAVPLIGYVISPAFKRREKPWVEVGSMDDVPVGEPKQLDYLATIQDGYLKSQIHKAIWAVKQTDETVNMFSPLCPHLGCGYNWDSTDKKFKCPCHGSVFDITGQVLHGPAPRRLDLLPTKVENGRILVMYKEFKSGIARQVEL